MNLTPLLKQLPVTNFFSSPRTVGRGGGVATIFKKHFNCRILSVECFASFEVQLCQVDLIYPIFCALIYRPPRYNKLFLKEFSDFVTTIVPNVDRLLILSDFNIHVCCPDKPLVSEFLQIIDSFYVFQSVLGATHEKGHTIDLILSLWVSVANCSD